MRSAARGCALAVALASLAGCGGGLLPARGEPVRLYALEAAAPAQRLSCPVRFSVRDTRLAGHLERPEVVVARDGPRIEAPVSAQWAAPLAAELKRQLSRALADRLEGSSPVPHPWRLEDAPRLAVSVDFDRLEPEGDRLRAIGIWRIADVAAGRSVEAGRFDESFLLAGSPGGDRAAATVAAIDAALGRLADQLAVRIAAGGGAECAAGASPASISSSTFTFASA